LEWEVAAYVINHLMRSPSIILQTIPILRARRFRKFLHHRQYLAQLIIRDVGQLRAVVFRDH
jgi:hypothetical protein